LFRRSLPVDKAGIVKIWRDVNACDDVEAQRRYAHPFYQASVRLTAAGYNLINLGGL
jgi:hypothetical protein